MTAKEDLYTLPRNKSESSRLDLQHRLITTNAGFLLHPIIAAQLPKDAKIADIGTGTGAWIEDLASLPTTPPTWTFHGYDISNSQFPSHGNEKCSYSILNILSEEMPDELIGAFDLVHLRYLILALTEKDWETVAKNVLKLLKPGGWIQWFESDFDIHMIQSSPNTSSSACTDLYSAVLELSREQGKIIPNFGLKDVMVRNGGFVDVKEEVFATDRVSETRSETSRMALRALRDIAKVGIKRRAEKWREDEGWVERKYEEAMREEEKGVYLRWDMHCVVGRKAFLPTTQ
ncbi:N-methyltransferase tcpN [Pseudocercospora fuligena]|uniref:N-methyltransferase tcpN n=1 Tax=Pseudocercospora fuligena TaxID=685502 RepID=A0A8H6RUZ7_9PEZI|nr:N-methyltransferase tcpN [Pseudocercospora fuligena]